MERFTLEDLDADSVRVIHNELPRFTMTFHLGGHDPLVPIDTVSEEAAAALQKAAIAFFDEDQQDQR